jgi:YD repeat-containing protein
VTTTYAYDAHDKLTSAGSKTYGYDLNGNCTSVTVGSSVTGITYPGGATNSFAYNGEDLRTRKVDSAGTKNYVTDGASPASAVLSDGAAVYTPGLSERLKIHLGLPPSKK